jgi:hypothetical protein
MTGRPSFPPLRSPAAAAAEPPKHVIEVYRHRDQTITCVCGWFGSSAANERGTSDWQAHLAEFRTRKR